MKVYISKDMARAADKTYVYDIQCYTSHNNPITNSFLTINAASNNSIIKNYNAKIAYCYSSYMM